MTSTACKAVDLFDAAAMVKRVLRVAEIVSRNCPNQQSFGFSLENGGQKREPDKIEYRETKDQLHTS
jgi:hypothetical protein